MNLLVFSYGIAIFLFFLSSYLDIHAVKSTINLSGLSIVTAFTALFASISATLFYTNNVTIGILATKICLVFLSFVITSLIRYSSSIPYLTRNRFLSFISWLLWIFSIYLIFTSIKTISWTETTGFRFESNILFGIVNGFGLFTFLYFLIIPALIVIVLLLRAAATKSRIYRQRILCVAGSICIGFCLSFFFYLLSKQNYWVLSLVPFGLAIMLILIYQSMSITTLFDRSSFFALLILQC